MPENGPVETVLPTPQGTIKSGWQIRDNQAQVTLDLPKGVQAEVRLAGIRKTVTGKNHWEIKLN